MAVVAPDLPIAQTAVNAISDASAFLLLALEPHGDFPDRDDVLATLTRLAQCSSNAALTPTFLNGDQQLQLLRGVLDASPHLSTVNLQAFSPQEICVFRTSLQQLSELQLFHQAPSQLAGVRAALDVTIANAMHGPMRDAFAEALQSDATQLRSLVMRTLETTRATKQVAQTLCDLMSRHNLLATALRVETREALRHMAAWATPLPIWAVSELLQSKALAICVTHCTTKELLQLRDALGRAASSGISAELLGLWSAVHETISSVRPADALATLANEAVADAVVSSTQTIGKLLLEALSSSMALASAVSVELQDALKNMAEHGVPLPSTSHIRQELETNAALIIQALPVEKLKELKIHVRQAISAEWIGISAALDHAVASLPPIVPAVLGDAIASAATELVYGNAFSAAIWNGDFDRKLNQIFLQSRERVHNAVLAIANGGLLATSGCMASLLATLPPLLRVEIMRDFCQSVSLVFTNLYGALWRHHDTPISRTTLLLFQSLFNVVSCDFTALWGDSKELLIDIGFGMLLFVVLLTYAAYVWFALSGRHLHRRSDEIRHGHEASSWAELAKKQQLRLRVFTAVITLCLSVYLPLTRLSLEIVAASFISTSANLSEMISPSTLVIVERYSELPFLWMVLQICSVVLLATFSLPLPLLLMRAINENKPTGSPENPLVAYDVDGEQVPFDDKVYARLVASDPSQLRCPYRSLYAGFEQRWSQYKVIQLLFKVALVVPLILTRQRELRSIFTSVVYTLIVAVTSYGTPFSDPLNNVMEVSGKLTALVTCVGGVVLAFATGNHHATLQLIVALVVNVVNALNLCVMVTIVLLGIPKTRLWIKNRLGTLTFSDTTRDLRDAPAQNVLPQWDLEKEAKHRLWHHFWHTLLLSLHGDNSAILQRLSSLQHAAATSGVANVARHWQGQHDPYTVSMRLAARRFLEGVDVFWDDASGARDGFLDSQSCFGKMYIHAYPFHCVVVYDDSNDESIIRDDKFPAFFFRNFTPEIVARRLVRHKLRALSEACVAIHFPFSRQESVTVPDGTETVTITDASGRSHTTTRPRHTTVTFTCFYTRGVIRVAANASKSGSSTSSSDHAMAAGFHVSMTYSDGCGDAVAPHTGEIHRQMHREAVMGADHVGLTPQMQESAQLAAIFQQTHAHWQPGVVQIHERHAQYRATLLQRHAGANAVLGDGFWYFVFNNPHLTRTQLHEYLETHERNPVLQQLPQTHATALDFLYTRLAFVYAHPACTLWYVFWDDVFARNGEMQRLKPFANELNPALASSIAYRVLKRDELTQWLKDRKLWGSPFSWKTLLLGRRCLFHDKTLQLLYERMQCLVEPHAIVVK